MIEIRKTDDCKEDDKYRLFIDGVLVEQGKVFIENPWERNNIRFSIVADDYKVVQDIIKHSLSDFPRVEYLRLKYISDTSEPIDSVLIYLSREHRKSFKILFGSTPDLSTWNKPYTYAEYCHELSLAIESMNNPDIELNVYKNNDMYIDSFEIGFSFPPVTNLPIDYGIAAHAEVIRRIHKKVIASLSIDKGFPIDNEVLAVKSQARMSQHQTARPIKLKEDESSKYRSEYQLFINGILMEQVSANARGSESLAHPYFEIYTKDKDASKQLAMFSLSEFPPLAGIHLSNYLDELKYLEGEIWIDQVYGENAFTGQFTVRMEFGGNALSEWRESYSFKEYAWEMFKALKAIDNLVEVDLMDSGSSYVNKEHKLEEDGPYYLDLSLEQINKERIQRFSLKFTYSSPKVAIADELKRISNIIRPIHEEIVSSLTSRLSNNSISLSFDFPEEVKVPCQQYLLYFAQFLKDLGVETNTALTQEAGQVLFTVTPDNKEQALDKIRVALEIYLQLATTPVNNITNTKYEVAIQRLAAEIQSLHSRLMLAQAEIQLKDAAIEVKQDIIDRQRLLSGEIMVEALKKVTPQPQSGDAERMFDYVAQNTKGEIENLSVNPSEIFRRLKLLFREKE
jgi:hypothetical protein